jgi:Kef-type K+ transport system membrane component KefB
VNHLAAIALGAAPSSDVSRLLATLAAIIIGTKLLGEAAQRLGQPAVLGELVAGVLLGGSVLGLVDPQAPVIHAMAELGVLVLLFQIGLHTDLQAMRRVGAAAATVGAVGVVLPFAGGLLASWAFGLPPLAAIVAATALTATSIGISARILGDLRRLHTPEGQVVLGAAILDDVVGLVILTVVGGLVAGSEVTALGVARTAGTAVGFIALALVAGGFVVPRLFRRLAMIRSPGTLGLLALAFALALAWLADSSGSAMIMGAFAAGLILHPTPHREDIERSMTSIGSFFVPVFFASVGAAVDLRAIASPMALGVGGALIAVGVAGKILAGYAPWWFEGNKLLIGVAMVPRGEVGLIFAQMGLSSGAIPAPVFGALMLMVVVTTLVTPPLLARVSRGSTTEEHALGGIDDLVSGPQNLRRPTLPVRRSEE